MRRSDREKPRRLWLKIPLIIILLLVLGIGAYAYSVYHNAKTTVNERMHDPVESIDTKLTKKKLNETDNLNVLLLGIDAKEGEAGRSDAIMIMRLNPQTDEMNIVSIPRDARAEIIGKGIDDKINHAYAFGAAADGPTGGATMAIDTVENFLDIEIDYYVSINMDGLIELVNELGSISVSNDVEWTDDQYDFPTGVLEMDGDKTMAYVRMRKKDPAGDFGRTMRQRKVIEGILQEGASVGSVPKFSGMVDILGSNMSTNMEFDDMKKLFSGYKDTRRNISEHMVNGNGQKIEGVYFLVVPEEEKQQAHDILTGS